MKGNAGEWSELYVLLRLLTDGRLYSADMNMNKLDDIYSPILRVFRRTTNKDNVEYKINNKRKEHIVELYINGDKIKSLTSEQLEESATKIYNGIINSPQERAFPINGSDEIMEEICCTQIKADSEDKTDIQMELKDITTGINRICGFSIKSDIGSPPTLLNASQQTNFIYQIDNLSCDDVCQINNISTKNKIVDKIKEIKQRGGKLKFSSLSSTSFLHNIKFIDSNMDEILGELLLLYYCQGIDSLSEAVTVLEKEDPVGFGCAGIYRYKTKKFLSAIALGMVPGKEWSGQDEANGGYIVVKENGDVVAYHLHNRDSFE